MLYEIFIDESGTLADAADRFVVVAAVATNNPTPLAKLMPKARKRIPPKRKLKRERLVSEFKFRNVGDRTKLRILQELSKAEIKLFVLILDKENRRVADTPKNYAKLVWTILDSCFVKLSKISKVVIDRHFSQPTKQNEFNHEVFRLAKKEFPIVHVDSLTDSRVDLADFVAGATLRSVRNKDSHFKEIIESKILVEKRYFWKKLKGGKT